MRYPKYLINAFAILGIVSFIFLACSAGETAMDNEDPIENGGDNGGENGDGGDGGDNNPPIQNNYGKYQISTAFRADSSILRTTILNTETGQITLYTTTTSGVMNPVVTENIAN